jgi:hypothetical protein
MDCFKEALSRSADMPASRLIPSIRNSQGCYRNHCTFINLTSVYSDSHLWPITASLRSQTRERHIMCNILQCVMDGASNVMMAIVEQYNTSCEHTRALVLIVIKRPQRVPQYCCVLVVMSGSVSVSFNSVPGKWMTAKWSSLDKFCTCDAGI